MKKLLLTFLCITVVILTNSVTFLEDEDPVFPLDENGAKKLAKKYRPFLKFDMNEEYFPAAIEWFKIEWPNGVDAPYVSFNYTGPDSLDDSAPIYASVLENQDGTVRISYVFLYAFNGCGPYMKINIGTIFGLQLEPELSICPAGQHFGDIEHIVVYLDADKQISGFNYGIHDSNATLRPEEVEMKGNHPVVYVAHGSHASYTSKGEKEIAQYWDIKGKTFSTQGILAERIEERTHNYGDAPIRLLKFNEQSATGISKDELNLAFNYPGRLGQPIQDPRFDGFKKEMAAYAAAILKPISEMAYQYFLQALEFLSSEVKKQSCPTLAGPGRDWW